MTFLRRFVFLTEMVKEILYKMRNQILQRCEHIMHPKQDHFHDSLCVLYQSIFIMIFSYCMDTVSPYKLPK